MLKKKVVACSVKHSVFNVYDTDISDDFESKSKKSKKINEVKSLEQTFIQTDIFCGTCLCEHKGDFSINPEIATCEDDGRPDDVGYISFEFRITDKSTEICLFDISIDFEYEKISLREIRVNDSYQKMGVMKRTLFNVFDCFVQAWPESKTFDVCADEIEHVAIFKFFFPNLTREESPPCNVDGSLLSSVYNTRMALEALYDLHKYCFI